MRVYPHIMESTTKKETSSSENPKKRPKRLVAKNGTFISDYNIPQCGANKFHLSQNVKPSQRRQHSAVPPAQVYTPRIEGVDFIVPLGEPYS